MLIKLKNGEMIDPLLIKDFEYFSDIIQGTRKYSVQVIPYGNNHFSRAWFDSGSDALDYIKYLKEAPQRHRANQLDDIMEVLSRSDTPISNEIYEIYHRKD